jgi:hypothetical protein
MPPRNAGIASIGAAIAIGGGTGVASVGNPVAVPLAFAPPAAFLAFFVARSSQAPPSFRHLPPVPPPRAS